MSQGINTVQILWRKLPLNKKFSVLILGILVFPTLISVNYGLETLEKEEIKNLSLSLERDLEQLQTNVYTNNSIARAVISMLQSNPQLTTALSIPLSTKELMDFHTKVTPYFENIAITNPYIRAVRIYANHEIMPERYSVFLDSDRVKNQSWFINSVPGVLDMRINYEEQLSEEISQYSAESLISFYQGLELYGEEKAVVEVSFILDDFFGEIFARESNGICIIRQEEEFFMSNQIQMDESEKEKLCQLLGKEYGKETTNATMKSWDNREYLVATFYAKDLDITYYMVNDLTQMMKEKRNIKIGLICCIFLCLGLFAFIIEKLANVLLRQIHVTITAMKELELGNTLVQIQSPSSDEIGQLQSYFNQMVVHINELIAKESNRALLEKDAELKALQNQINSHFLYNVLNNIEMMAIIEENFLIADTVTALARLLRYSMKWDTQMVPLAKELDYVQDYIQLFNMRFDNEISLICDISKEAENALIPKMSVQPAVENSIIHGIEESMSDEIIRIVAKVQSGILTIAITDTGTGMDAESLQKLRENLAQNTHNSISGIGLNNVIERIHTRFGSNYGIQIDSELGKFTKVTLAIPVIENMEEE